MNTLILGMFNILAPIVRQMIVDHQAANNGAMPTDADMQAKFEGDIDRYVAEGAAWRAAHPTA